MMKALPPRPRRKSPMVRWRDRQVAGVDANLLFLELLGGGGLQAAVDAVSDFTRNKIRESGFARRILPPVEVTG